MGEREAQVGRFVSRVDSDVLIAAVQRGATDAQAGLFGPESASWRVNREAAVFLGAGRAALLQLAHPWVATALQQHSDLMQKPIARFHNTFRIVFTMIFGTAQQATAAARHLYQLHTHIQGELTQAAGAHPRGEHYEANETAALRWVFATLVESAVLAYDCVLPELNAEKHEAYYRDSVRMAALFGLQTSDLPPDWGAFVAYCRAMESSLELGVTASARTMAQGLLRGAGSWIKPPRWYRALTAEWLAPRFREEFGLEFGPDEAAAAAKARVRLPLVYRRLPRTLRFVGPWHEAQARLRGRAAGPVSRINTRFWIGQWNLPFGTGAEPGE